MGAVGYLVALLLAAGSFGGALYSYLVLRQKPGVTEHDLSAPLVAVVTTGTALAGAVITLVAYLAWYRDDLKAWREQRRKLLGDELYDLLGRMPNEIRNLERIRDKPAPEGGHGKPVEVFPFEILAEKLGKIKDVRYYKRRVRRLLREIKRVGGMGPGKKDVTRLIPMLERLQAELEYDVKGYPRPK